MGSGRQKTKMAYIANAVSRRRTFLKRKTCLLKKASELSILCGVHACVLVGGPCEPNPVIWPSALDARTLITRFRDLPTSSSRDKRALDQDAFLAREIARLRDQLGRAQRKIREAEVKAALMRFLRGDAVGADMDEVGSLVEGKAREVGERLDHLNGMLFGGCLGGIN
ncbi:Agamous-like MADS-box protein AGL15 [Acorus calamus]|uniref:Agamous-like MADS-box protein AGL15 n=1 Tax=Acorus calamus TaxID=4465 RepID=A0AAV9DI82_ACOCL|nr:Agamous-like MADS-box protein AGL15 [Acorus calamus]